MCMYIVVKEKPFNIFEMKIFWQLPLSIHNIYINIHFKSTMFFATT